MKKTKAKYLLVSEDEKIMDFIKITEKTIREYVKFKDRGHIYCLGDYFLVDLFKKTNDLEDLKRTLIKLYPEIEKV